MARSKMYRVKTDGTSEPVEKVAEAIEELARSIRTHPNNLPRVDQDAEAIMHLAADIRLNGERLAAKAKPANA